MESFRLKNIIILILVLTNSCLLVVLANRQSGQQNAQRQAQQQLTDLFAAEGVKLDPETIPTQTPPAPRTLVRDTDQEQSLAAFFLGTDLRRSNRGGGIYLYGSDQGGAQFLDNGSFDAAGALSGTDGEAVCRSFCETFGYEDLTFSADGTSAAAVQYCAGYPVFNSTVAFTLDDGVLMTATGVHLPETSVETAAERPLLSATAALTAFLEICRESGGVSSAVTRVSLCYELQSTTAAPMALTPAWHIETDISGLNYYVNCVTGAVTHG